MNMFAYSGQNKDASAKDKTCITRLSVANENEVHVVYKTAESADGDPNSMQGKQIKKFVPFRSSGTANSKIVVMTYDKHMKYLAVTNAENSLKVFKI